MIFVAHIAFAADPPDVNQQLKEIQKTLDRLQAKLNELSKATPAKHEEKTEVKTEVKKEVKKDGMKDGMKKESGEYNEGKNRVTFEVKDGRAGGRVEGAAAPETMREWLREIMAQLGPKNREHLTAIIGDLTSRIGRQPQAGRLQGMQGRAGMRPGMPMRGMQQGGMRPAMQVGRPGMPMRGMQQGGMMRPGMQPGAMPPGGMNKPGMQMGAMQIEVMAKPEGQGFLSQLPEPMRQNALEWIFYILTHKPPTDGMPPKMELMKPGVEGMKPGAGMPPKGPQTAAGPMNDMVGQLKQQLVERDNMIKRLNSALEEAKKGGGGDYAEMEKRVKGRLDEMEKAIQAKDQEFKKAMEHSQAQINELKAKLDEAHKSIVAKEETIAKQNKRISELEQLVKQLKEKVGKN
jgi:predicted  nucleic acid-binding Zn-ribbon protein